MNPKVNIAVIIPAAGISKRFGGSTPKQFLRLGDETVIEKSVNLFLEINKIKKIVIAIDPNEPLIELQSFYNDPKVTIVEGGNTRSQSVFNALLAIDQDIDTVAIHDAARPWLTENLVENLLLKFSEDQSIQGVFPVVSITDSLREKN